MRTLIYFFVLLILAGITSGQKQNPNIILNKVKEKFNLVEDYVVDVNIKLNLSFLDAPVSKAKIYFKKPDKIKIKSDGFALLPKAGVNFSPIKLLNHNYFPKFVKSDTVSGFETYIININPKTDSLDIISTTLWIDSKSYVIRKIETLTKIKGTFAVNMEYGKMISYGLPKKVVFKFNIGKLDYPMNLPEQMSKSKARTMGRSKRKLEGSVEINYFNYKVNLGLDEIIFQDKK